MATPPKGKGAAKPSPAAKQKASRQHAGMSAMAKLMNSKVTSSGKSNAK